MKKKKRKRERGRDYTNSTILQDLIQFSRINESTSIEFCLSRPSNVALFVSSVITSTRYSKTQKVDLTFRELNFGFP